MSQCPMDYQSVGDLVRAKRSADDIADKMLNMRRYSTGKLQTVIKMCNDIGTLIFTSGLVLECG